MGTCGCTFSYVCWIIHTTIHDHLLHLPEGDDVDASVASSLGNDRLDRSSDGRLVRKSPPSDRVPRPSSSLVGPIPLICLDGSPNDGNARHLKERKVPQVSMYLFILGREESFHNTPRVPFKDDVDGGFLNA